MNTPQFYLNDFEAFDLRFSNFLQGKGYQPLLNQKINYPTDVYTDETALYIDIPIADGNVDDIKVTTVENELKVKYHRSNKESTENIVYHYRGITKRDFEVGWKIPIKFDLSQLSSSFKNGMLKLIIPRSAASFPKEIAIVDLNKQLN
jgi:HSP20 family molecular chaperone IbpA